MIQIQITYGGSEVLSQLFKCSIFFSGGVGAIKRRRLVLFDLNDLKFDMRSMFADYALLLRRGSDLSTAVTRALPHW